MFSERKREVKGAMREEVIESGVVRHGHRYRMPEERMWSSKMGWQSIEVGGQDEVCVYVVVVHNLSLC